MVASDETSARVGGKTWWQWVLLSSTAVYHVIAAHRSAAVVSDFLGGAIPEVWVADRYAAQAGHGAQRQVCLAHLLRDAQFAIDAGDAVFAAGFRKLLLRSIAIGQRRADLKDTTLAQYRADLDRRLDRLLAVAPTVPAGRKLARGIAKCRGDLFVFVTRRDVPCTNNGCERALRPSVIFRKCLPRRRCCVPEDWREGARLWQALEMVQQRLLLREEAQLVPVVHRRDPRARGATPASLAARRVGGSCGPTGASVCGRQPGCCKPSQGSAG